MGFLFINIFISYMKIIITESQYVSLLNEATSPCPEGKKEDTLITLDQVRKVVY